MQTIRTIFSRLGLAPLLLLAMLVAVGTSSVGLRADTPTCDGHNCNPDVSNDCGSKCICNSVDRICLDNTEQQLN